MRHSHIVQLPPHQFAMRSVGKEVAAESNQAGGPIDLGEIELDLLRFAFRQIVTVSCPALQQRPVLHIGLSRISRWHGVIVWGQLSMQWTIDALSYANEVENVTFTRSIGDLVFVPTTSHRDSQRATSCRT